MAQIFISYAHADKAKLNDALTHLAPLENAGLVQTWTDQQIPAGSDWATEIDKAMGESDIAILLVTPSFHASRFITETELPLLLNKKVFWIPVSASSYELTPLAKLQAAHEPSQPLSNLSKPKRDAAWVEIVRKLRAALTNP